MQAYYDGLLERLREARTQNGMTQREASVALGMAHSYMNKCESGERAIEQNSGLSQNSTASP